MKKLRSWKVRLNEDGKQKGDFYLKANPGSPISRQVSRGTDVPVRIFLILFLTLAECVIPD